MKCISFKTKFVKRLLNKAALNMRIMYACQTKFQLKIPGQRKGTEGHRQVYGITSAILSTLFDDLDRETDREGIKESGSLPLFCSSTALHVSRHFIMSRPA